MTVDSLPVRPPRIPQRPSRSSARRLTWPPLTEGSTLAAAVTPLREEHERISADLRTTQKVLAGADLERRRASAEDATALAIALRAGAKDPGPVRATSVENSLVEQQRRGNALFAARAAIETDVVQLLVTRLGEFEAEAEAAIEARRADASEALDALAAALGGLAQAKATRRWLADPRRAVGLVTPKVDALRSASGEPMVLNAVLAGIRSLLDADPPVGYMDETLGDRVAVGDAIRDPEGDD